MSERVHEVLQKERRAGHEHEQRQMRIVETEGLAEQLDEERQRDEPDGAAEREHQPHRYFRTEKRYQGAGQRAFGKTEMIVDQQVDIRDVRRQRNLVEKNPDDNRGVDSDHQLPFFSLRECPPIHLSTMARVTRFTQCHAKRDADYKINRLKSAFLARSPTCFCT
jgi:hypothetical protein